MTNQTMKNIEKEIKDLVSKLDKINNTDMYAYHHKIEYQTRAIKDTAKNIKYYQDLEVSRNK